MANPKASISDWEAFARNPTDPEDTPAESTHDRTDRSSVVFKETFIERITNDEGKVLSRTKQTTYTSAGGLDLTKDDYDRAKAKDDERRFELERRRNLAAEQRHAGASWPATMNPSETSTKKLDRPESVDSLPASRAPPSCKKVPHMAPVTDCQRTNLPHLRSNLFMPPKPISKSQFNSSSPPPKEPSNTQPFPNRRNDGFVPPHLRANPHFIQKLRQSSPEPSG